MPAGEPFPPSGLTATATSSSSIALSWTDTSSNETGFLVERSTNPTTGFTQIALVGAGVTSFTNNTGLSGAATYYYRVRATNSAGDSSYSNTATATTPPVATAPAAPTNLTATAQSSTSVRLVWSDNANDETGFKIERSTSAASGFTQVAAAAANVVSYTDTGRAAQTTYFYRIRATTSQGVADTQSPKAFTFSRTSSGTYYYRVRAIVAGVASGWSNVVPVQVTLSAVRTLRIINDLDHRTAGSNIWGLMNKIIRVRIGTAENAVITSTALEKLWPSDSASASSIASSYVIDPVFNQTTSYWDFDVSSFTSGSYWVYMQNGWWELVTDPFSGLQSWEKHMTQVAGCNINQTVYKWATFSVSNHQSGVFSIRASQYLPMGNWFGSAFCP